MRCIPIIWLLAGCTGAADEPAPTPDEPAVQVDDPAEDSTGADATTLRALAMAAYQSGDLERFVTLQKKALDADPSSTISRYNLACGYALTNRRDEALAELRTLLKAGIDYGASLDGDFTSLADDPEFQEIVAAFEELHPEVSHSSLLTQVGDGVDLAPEGIAVDPATGRTFVSSMRTGEIWVVDDLGASARPLTALSVDSTPVSAFGLRFDPTRGVLWAVGAAFSLHQEYKPEHQGTTAVIGLDPATGQVLSTHARKETTSSGFNDVEVAPNGTLYLTGGDLYMLPEGAEHPTPVGLSPALTSSNGITNGGSPDVLYVSANRSGIARIDLKTTTWEWLEAPKGMDLRSFDGLAYGDGSLVGIQLGMKRWRAVRLDLNEDGTAITGLQVLEQGHPDIAFATTGVVVDDAFRYVARAPLAPGTDRAAAGPAGGATMVWTVPVRP